MKKILITRKLLKQCEEKALKLFDVKLNINDELYSQQKLIVEAKNRLESIVQDYKNTTASSEAYYLLGQFAISDDWDLDAAVKYFQMVPKENMPETNLSSN